MSYRQRRRYVTVELTKMQYVELQALYDWHYKQLTKDMKRMQKESRKRTYKSIGYSESMATTIAKKNGN